MAPKDCLRLVLRRRLFLWILAGRHFEFWTLPLRGVFCVDSWETALQEIPNLQAARWILSRVTVRHSFGLHVVDWRDLDCVSIIVRADFESQICMFAVRLQRMIHGQCVTHNRQHDKNGI